MAEKYLVDLGGGVYWQFGGTRFDTHELECARELKPAGNLALEGYSASQDPDKKLCVAMDKNGKPFSARVTGVGGVLNWDGATNCFKDSLNRVCWDSTAYDYVLNGQAIAKPEATKRLIEPVIVTQPAKQFESPQISFNNVPPLIWVAEFTLVASCIAMVVRVIKESKEKSYPKRK